MASKSVSESGYAPTEAEYAPTPVDAKSTPDPASSDDLSPQLAWLQARHEDYRKQIGAALETIPSARQLRQEYNQKLWESAELEARIQHKKDLETLEIQCNAIATAIADARRKCLPTCLCVCHGLTNIPMDFLKSTFAQQGGFTIKDEVIDGALYLRISW
jgi:hypothetical protein